MNYELGTMVAFCTAVQKASEVPGVPRKRYAFLGWVPHLAMLCIAARSSFLVT